SGLIWIGMINEPRYKKQNELSMTYREIQDAELSKEEKYHQRKRDGRPQVSMRFELDCDGQGDKRNRHLTTF
uniref:hypothetical protein n=4 Tax=Vibrio anguillarum TaxID=55601 RepID=UPI001BE4527F